MNIHTYIKAIFVQLIYLFLIYNLWLSAIDFTAYALIIIFTYIIFSSAIHSARSKRFSYQENVLQLNRILNFAIFITILCILVYGMFVILGIILNMELIQIPNSIIPLLLGIIFFLISPIVMGFITSLNASKTKIYN